MDLFQERTKSSIKPSFHNCVSTAAHGGYGFSMRDISWKTSLNWFVVLLSVISLGLFFPFDSFDKGYCWLVAFAQGSAR